MLFLKTGPGKKTFLSLAWCVACLLCGLVSFVYPTSQQEQKQPQSNVPQKMPVFSVEAAMVVVDVTVRDGKGRLIADLKREDFKIYEDNVPQDIVTFSAENVAIGPVPATSPSAAGTAETAPSRPAAIVNLGLNPDAPIKKEDIAGKRLIILFFDLSSLGTENLFYSIDAAHDFIAKQTGPQDLMAVATYSSALSLVQDFTNDRDLLLKTLNAISSSESGESETESTSTSDTSTSSDTSSSEEVFVPDSVQFNIFNTDRRLSALETLAKMYRELPERKSLIYFSSGVVTTGVENNAQIRSTVDAANRSNMSIYTVDSQGLVALPPGGDASRGGGGGGMFGGSGMMRQRNNLSSSQETLVTLSYDTGGRSFNDTNDLSLAMKQAQSDTNVYYVLGYFSTNRKEDGKYRKIRVELERPNVKNTHRPGYFASKAFGQLSQEERDLQLSQAMNVERPFVDVPLILQADYFRKDDKTVYVPISIEILGDALKFVEKGSNREGKFEFVAQASDSKGRTTGIARDAVTLKVPSERAETLRSGGIFYSTGFQLRPGEHKLKFLVRDNTSGKLGSFEQPITVPVLDLKKLALSSIVLGSQLVNTRGDSSLNISRQGPMRRFQQMIPSYDPLVMGNRKVVPSIGNVFLARQTVYVYFHVYGAVEDSETKTPCIETDLMLLRDNTKILETQPQYTQSWTQVSMGPGFGPGRGGGMGPGMMGPGMGGPGDMEPPDGGPGRMGGPPGMQGAEERKGEATVAISLPLKNLKRGTYMLQVHVRDEITNSNIFQRVPIVIE
ncbi:MAG: VWA domain-containing protein [Acidobacteria bacterium]|nr:VWA domain-containing protein [Acidobacteriota bacterium]